MDLKEYGISHPTEIRWRDKHTGWHDSWNMVFKNESTNEPVEIKNFKMVANM